MAKRTSEYEGIILTPEQTVKALRIVYSFAEGCSFAGDRRWEYEECGKDQHRGYSCSDCQAEELIHELGFKTMNDEAREREEERKRYEPPKKKKRGKLC